MKGLFQKGGGDGATRGPARGHRRPPAGRAGPSGADRAALAPARGRPAHGERVRGRGGRLAVQLQLAPAPAGEARLRGAGRRGRRRAGAAMAGRGHRLPPRPGRRHPGRPVRGPGAGVGPAGRGVPAGPGIPAARGRAGRALAPVGRVQHVRAAGHRRGAARPGRAPGRADPALPGPHPGRRARRRAAGARDARGLPAAGRAVNLLLSRPGFRRLWTSGAVSETGDWLLLIALPVYVPTLTTSTVFLLELAGALAASPLAGVLADRWDRRRLLIGASLTQAALLLPLLAVDGRGTLWIV